MTSSNIWRQLILPIHVSWGSIKRLTARKNTNKWQTSACVKYHHSHHHSHQESPSSSPISAIISRFPMKSTVSWSVPYVIKQLGYFMNNIAKHRFLKFCMGEIFFASVFRMMGGCFWKWNFWKILTPYGVSTRNFVSEIINF